MMEDYFSSFLRRPSTAAPASPATAPRRADDTDAVSPVLGSAADWLCFCEPLADSDCDNDSEPEVDWLIEADCEPLPDTDWLIELEYEPLPDVEPDCD